MKRYPVVLGATVAGLAGVLTFQSHGTTHALPSGPLASAAPSGQPPRQHTAGPKTGSSTPRKSPDGGAKNVSTGGASMRQTTGSLEQYGYGQLSVRVTMKGSNVTTATVATLQVADQYSQTLANQVIPTLEREVIDAQSAHIQGISGATYTSEAYALSVQSALDKLRA